MKVSSAIIVFSLMAVPVFGDLFSWSTEARADLFLTTLENSSSSSTSDQLNRVRDLEMNKQSNCICAQRCQNGDDYEFDTVCELGSAVGLDSVPHVIAEVESPPITLNRCRAEDGPGVSYSKADFVCVPTK